MIGKKIETFCDRRYKKEKLEVQRDNLVLFRRKHGVAHEEESDNELENKLNFVFFTHFFQASNLFGFTFHLN